jgi:class III poly(R)-hydroxyalkanoic acid synthase PhaE subunit
MISDKDAGTARASESLYRWWFDVIPAAFAGMTPDPNTNGAAASSDIVPKPFPVEQTSQALLLTQQLLRPLYEGLLQALLTQQPAQALGAFERLLRGRLEGMHDALAGMAQAVSSRQPGLAAFGSGLATAPLAVFGEALTPLSLNLERAYGGLADAFGLASSRELQQAAREMAAASMAHRQAQLEYLGLVAAALGKGTEGLMARLADMEQRGEHVDSMTALLRLWARATDEAIHGAMQSPRALEASAKLIRAATRSRRQQQRVVALASEALNVPTRAEVDSAHREIQQLKRELRRLRKSMEPVVIEPRPRDGAAKRQAPAATRTGASAAKGKYSRKVTTA